jgi:hypothetical protein
MLLYGSRLSLSAPTGGILSSTISPTSTTQLRTTPLTWQLPVTVTPATLSTTRRIRPTESGLIGVEANVRVVEAGGGRTMEPAFAVRRDYLAPQPPVITANADSYGVPKVI